MIQEYAYDLIKENALSYDSTPKEIMTILIKEEEALHIKIPHFKERVYRAIVDILLWQYIRTIGDYKLVL